MRTHTFKRGNVVTVFNMTMSGRFRIEGKATILKPVHDVDEQYFVQFQDDDGKATPGAYERFVDPQGQADPQAHVDALNGAVALS